MFFLIANFGRQSDVYFLKIIFSHLGIRQSEPKVGQPVNPQSTSSDIFISARSCHSPSVTGAKELMSHPRFSRTRELKGVLHENPFYDLLWCFYVVITEFTSGRENAWKTQDFSSVAPYVNRGLKASLKDEAVGIMLWNSPSCITEADKGNNFSFCIHWACLCIFSEGYTISWSVHTAGWCVKAYYVHAAYMGAMYQNVMPWEMFHSK